MLSDTLSTSLKTANYSSTLDSLSSTLDGALGSDYAVSNDGTNLFVVFLPTTGPESVERFTARVQEANTDVLSPYDALLVVARLPRKYRPTPPA